MLNYRQVVPGRLAVGRMALDHVARVRILPRQPIFLSFLQASCMKSLDAYIESGRDRLVTLLREMVCLPTVNPTGRHYAEMVAFLRERCERLGLKTQTLRVPTHVARRVIPHPTEYPRWNLLAR